MRFTTFHSQDLARLREGYQRLDQLDRLVRSVRPHFLQQIELAVSLIAEQRNRVQNRSGAETAPDSTQELLDSYRQREELAHRALGNLDKMERLALRWKESLDGDRQQLSLTARVRDLFGGFSSFTSKLWHFELLAAEDTITVDGQTIRAGAASRSARVVSAILILAVGYWFTVFLSHGLERAAVNG